MASSTSRSSRSMSCASVNADGQRAAQLAVPAHGHADAALHALQRGVDGRDHLLGVGVGGDRAAGGQHLPGDPLADGQPHAEPLVGAVEPGGRDARAGVVGQVDARVRAADGGAGLARERVQHLLELQRHVERVRGAGERPVAVGLGEPALLRGQPGEAERGLVAERLGDQRLVGRPDVGGAAGDDGHRVHVALPRERDEQRGAGLQRRGELGAQLGDQPAVVEREGAGRAHHVGDRGRVRPGVEHVHAVGAQREPGLRDQRRAQLVGRARGQRRLGETAERRVRAVRAS